MKKLLATVALMVLAGFCFGQSPRAVVVPLENRAGSAHNNDVETLTDLFMNFINDTRRLNVIDRGAVNSMMKEQRVQADAWADDDKAAEMGKLLNARYVIRSAISMLGNSFIVSSRVLDITTTETVSSANVQFRSMDEALSKMEELASNLTRTMRTTVQQPQQQPRQNELSQQQQSQLQQQHQARQQAQQQQQKQPEPSKQIEQQPTQPSVSTASVSGTSDADWDVKRSAFIDVVYDCLGNYGVSFISGNKNYNVKMTTKYEGYPLTIELKKISRIWHEIVTTIAQQEYAGMDSAHTVCATITADIDAAFERLLKKSTVPVIRTTTTQQRYPTNITQDDSWKHKLFYFGASFGIGYFNFAYNYTDYYTDYSGGIIKLKAEDKTMEIGGMNLAGRATADLNILPWLSLTTGFSIGGFPLIGDIVTLNFSQALWHVPIMLQLGGRPGRMEIAAKLGGYFGNNIQGFVLGATLGTNLARPGVVLYFSGEMMPGTGVMFDCKNAQMYMFYTGLKFGVVNKRRS